MTPHGVLVLEPASWTEPLAAELVRQGRYVGIVRPGADLATLMSEEQTPEQFVLVASDSTALRAVEFAERHPERVAGVLVPGAHAKPNGAEPAAPCPILPVRDDGDSVAQSVLSLLSTRFAGDNGPAVCPVRLPPLSPMLMNDPAVVGQLRDLAPIHRIHMAGVASPWVLTGYGSTIKALRDPSLRGDVQVTLGFRPSPADGPRVEDDVVGISVAEHARLRKLISRYLTPRRVAAFVPRIQDEADRVLDDLAPRQSADLVKHLAEPLPVGVISALIGIPEKERERVRDWLVVRMRAVPRDPASDIDDLLLRLVAAERKAPDDTFFGWVLDGEGERVPDTDLVSAARLLMVGSHRPTGTLLANGVAALLRHRDQWELLVSDLGLVTTATEELLRFVTPFPIGLARHVTTPMTVGREHIRPGELIAASLVAANRDPVHFADPDILDITRASNPHLSFGHGHHYCLGAALARAEIRIAIAGLARRFPDLALAGDAQALHYRQSRVRYLLQLPVVLRRASA